MLEVIVIGFDLHSDIEITLEANPGTVSFIYFKELRELGINRISVGMQSIIPGELKLLERQHDAFDIIHSIKWARQAGFENINLDLIFGLPDQGISQWQKSLIQAVGLRPDHLSLYALSLEHGTPLRTWVDRGIVNEPDDDIAADMYDWSTEYLGQNEYDQYEISNWAVKGVGEEIKSCRHNLQYWRNLPYLGVGAGAHGFVDGYRTANILSPMQYIQRCLEGGVNPFPRTPATASLLEIDSETEMHETMMMGLRLTREGISALDFSARFGKSIEEVFGKEIETLIGLGLLEWGNMRRLRLTKAGRLLGNQVFIRFV